MTFSALVIVNKLFFFFVSHATFFDVNYFFKSIVLSLDRCKELNNIFVLYILHFVRSFSKFFAAFRLFFFFVFVLCLFLV